MTLADFLLARADVDERDARTYLPAHDVPPEKRPMFTEMGNNLLVRAEVTRRFVEVHKPYPVPQHMTYGTITACEECGSVDDSPVEWPCRTLRIQALHYVDSHDYDEAWRP